MKRPFEHRLFVRIVGHSAISVAGIPCSASSTPYAMVGQSVILTDPGTDVPIVEYGVPVSLLSCRRRWRA